LPPTIDALRGCAVFPCVPGGKVPALETGWKEASADSAVIAAWASANPSFNWAVACGLSGLFVLDIDPEGLAWWHELVRLNADIATAVEGHVSGSHAPRRLAYLFPRAGAEHSFAHRQAGIDTRGGMTIDGKLVSGGYVVLPGSRTDKGYYEAINANADCSSFPTASNSWCPSARKPRRTGSTRTPISTSRATSRGRLIC
jgi:hypothetical protein